MAGLQAPTHGLVARMIALRRPRASRAGRPQKAMACPTVSLRLAGMLPERRRGAEKNAEKTEGKSKPEGAEGAEERWAVALDIREKLEAISE